MAKRYCRSLQDADRRDIVQEVMLTCSARLAAQNPPDKPLSWLAGALCKRRAMWLRARSVRRALQLLESTRSEADGDTTREVAGPAAPTDRAAEWKLLLGDLAQHLSVAELEDVRAMAAGECCADVARRERVAPDRVERRWKRIGRRLRRLIG